MGTTLGGDYLAYSTGVTARPTSLRTIPFTAVTVSDTSSEQDRQQLEANTLLKRQLWCPTDSRLRDRFRVILRQDNDAWDVDSPVFEPAVCLYGVVRDRPHEKVWDSVNNGRVVEKDDTNYHVFACACSSHADTGSGLVMSQTVGDLPASALNPWLLDESSQSSTSTSVSLTSSLSSDESLPPPYSERIHPPHRCSQRAPFEHHEDIAYGLVKRWVVVRQGRSGELSTVIAHVRIFVSLMEEVLESGLPMIQITSPPQYEDHYMLAKHIVCRIMLSPVPNDSSRFLVSHTV